MAFSFDVQYKKGCENVIPDFCSRFPKFETVNKIVNEEEENDEAFINAVLEEEDLTSRIQTESEKCPEIKEICEFMENGWPKKNALLGTNRNYFLIRQELMVNNGTLLRGQRIVVPESMRADILRRAHECHLGIQKTKLRLRSSYWWPNMGKQVEELIRDCYACAQASKSLKMGPSPSKEGLPSLPIPSMAWQRVAIDIKGPMNDLPASERYAVVLIDLFSKWPEVLFISSTESHIIIQFLKSVFAREGYPEEILSDNGTQFCSKEFSDFLCDHDIRHVKTPLYNPESNSVVERFNRTLAEQVELARIEKVSIRTYMQQFLQIYRSTQHSTTGCSPTLLLHGREIRTKLNTRKDSANEKKVRFQLNEVPFPIGTRVCVKHPRTGRVSRNLVVTKTVGTKSVVLDNGQKWHVSKIAKDHSKIREEPEDYELPDISGRKESSKRREVPIHDNDKAIGDRDTTSTTDDTPQNETTNQEEPVIRRSERNVVRWKRDHNFVYY
jgi:hypothetical protein